MKFSLCSDLHLEFRDEFEKDLLIEKINKSEADYNILAGDIDSSPSKLNNLLNTLNNPIHIDGNHEYYKNTKEISDNIQMIDLNGVKVIKCTLWTSFNNGNPMDEYLIYSGLNDSTYISNYDVELIKKINKDNTEFIFDNDPDIVITHHAPSFHSVHPRFLNSLINFGFVNQLDGYIYHSKIKVWCHGHVHNKLDYKIKNTRILCNPLGYPKENYINLNDYDLMFFEV